MSKKFVEEMQILKPVLIIFQNKSLNRKKQKYLALSMFISPYKFKIFIKKSLFTDKQAFNKIKKETKRFKVDDQKIHSFIFL